MFLARVAFPLIFNQLGLVLSSRQSRLQDNNHVATPYSLRQISPPTPSLVQNASPYPALGQASPLYPIPLPSHCKYF